jgi:hypothetical protein
MDSLKTAMFTKARKELHKHLKKYMFSLVTRAVTIPPECVTEDGEVNHYYTTSDELVVGSRNKSGSVWIKKNARSRQHQLGPVLISSSTSLPKPGDVIFGEVMKSSERKFGKQSFKEERQSYKWWMCPGAPLYYLATMVLKGTSETEESLRILLKLQDNYDDLWMLARVILFNNIQCFADMLNPGLHAVPCIKLREQPAVFVQQLSLWLDDFSILTEFQKLIPANVPLPTKNLIPPLSATQPLSSEPVLVKQFIGRKRRQPEKPHLLHDSREAIHDSREAYDPDEPSYKSRVNGYDFSNRQPAGLTSAPGIPRHSPPVSFVPLSPSYELESPPYMPTTPPYMPTTPPYMQ